MYVLYNGLLYSFNLFIVNGGLTLLLLFRLSLVGTRRVTLLETYPVTLSW